MQDDPLDTELQSALDALPRELTPPPSLEPRVVEGLRAAGRVGRSSLKWRAWSAAAVALVFGLGVLVGRTQSFGAHSSPQAQYLLLLYDAASTTSDGRLQRVAEYSAWARAEAATGGIVGGEELGDRAAVLGPVAPPLGEPTGYFLLAATSRGQAEAIAARCPHLRHGGTLVLWPIVSSPSP